MMSNTATIPFKMAWKTEAMPCTMPMRHAPMDWKTDFICQTRARVSVSSAVDGRRVMGGMKSEIVE